MVKDAYTNVCLCNDERTVQLWFTNIMYCLTYLGSQILPLHIGQEMREVDATGGKMKGRKEVRVDVTKRKSITRMMTGRKEAGNKGTTEKAAGEKSVPMEMQNGGATLKQ